MFQDKRLRKFSIHHVIKKKPAGGGFECRADQATPELVLIAAKLLQNEALIAILKNAAKRQQVLRAAEASQRPVEKIWHLRIYDAYDKDYWLDLEMTGSARLAKLDHYLRSIWLECFDHLSMFTIGGWGASKSANPAKPMQCLRPA